MYDSVFEVWYNGYGKKTRIGENTGCRMQSKIMRMWIVGKRLCFFTMPPSKK
jgi:hypothetical protein